MRLPPKRPARPAAGSGAGPSASAAAAEPAPEELAMH